MRNQFKTTLFLLIMSSILWGQDHAANRVKGFKFHAEWNPDSTLHYLVPFYQSRPTDDSVGIAVAEACLWKKDYKTATQILSALKNTESGDAMRVKGLLMEQAGRFPEALAAYEKAIPLLPKPWGTLERKAQVLAWTGKSQEAFVVLHTILKSKEASKGLKLRCQLHMALWTAWDKQLDKALDIVLQVIKEDGKYVDAWLLKGQIEEWKGEYGKAKESYGKVLVLQSQNGDARLRLGKLQWVK